MIRDLREYKYIIVNSSSGKDSQTLLDVICTKAKEQGVLDRVIVAHADLGKIEWPGTMDLAKKQADIYNVPFWSMARPQGDLLDYARKREKWPSPAQRWCTSDLKRAQLQKLYTEISRSCPGENIKILNCMGMRAEESPFRAKLPVFKKNERGSTKTREVFDYLPLKDWSLSDVWKNIKASGVPHHVVYDYGMPRLSCVFCIFATRPALLLAGKHNRELLAEYVQVEKEIGHTFKSGFRIAEIQEALEAGEVPEPVTDWRM